MLLFYIPCTSLAEAKNIGKKLVEEKLVACANIIKDIETIYRWEGKVNENNEVLLLVKGPERNHEKIEKLVKGLHSYDVPCIIAIKPHTVEKEYAEWLEKETSD